MCIRDSVVTARVELEVGDPRGVQARRELVCERLAGREHRAETVHPDERGPAPASRLGENTVERDAVPGGDPDQRYGGFGRSRHGPQYNRPGSSRALDRDAFSGEDTMLTHEENELITRISPVSY